MNKTSIAILAALFLAGCGKEKVAVQTDSDAVFASLPSEAVVVEFDGHALTKHEIDNRVAVFTEWFKLRNPQVGAAAVEGFRLKNARRIARQFPSKILLMGAAAGIGVEPTQELLARERDRLVAVFGTKKNNTFDALVQALPSKLRKCAEEMVQESAYCEAYVAYQKQKKKVDTSVSDKDIKEVEDEADEKNKVAKELHEKSRQKAAAIYKRLKAGENFSRLADECSETIKDDGPAGVWGVFELSEIPYEEIVSRVRDMKQWEYTEPMELYDAIHIVRVLNIEKPADGETAYTLGRIVIKLPMYYKAASRDEIKVAVHRQKEEEFQTELLKELRGDLMPTYPSGTNLWRHATTQRQKNLAKISQMGKTTEKKGK